MKELLTEKQTIRRARDMRIAAVYASMRKQYPKASQTLIISTMANNGTEGVKSRTGIRTALIRVGVISI